MSDNYLEMYKNEGSESSYSSEEDDKNVIAKSKQQAQQDTTTKKPDKPKNPNKYTPYTFDPKSILEEYQSPETNANANKPKYDYSSSVVGYSQKSINYPQAVDYGSRGKDPYKMVDPYSAKFDFSYMASAVDDVASCRRSDEYKNYCQDFDKKYLNNQKEMEQVSKDLLGRTTRIDEFIQELMGANLDMILYKNRLARELEDVKNDLKEAYNNISVLMKERSSLKDQFSIYKVKIKKLKGCIGTFQEDNQA